MLTGNTKAEQLALKALADEKPDVREAATAALGGLKEKSSIPELKQVIQSDKEATVVLGAARALIAMNDPFGYGVFYAVLTGEKKSGASLMEDQKKMLKDPRKLAQFGFEQGVGFVPFGGIGLTVVKSLTKDDVSPVRAAAAKMLAADPDLKSLAALEEATGDPSWIVQVAAIAAIAQRNDMTTMSTLEMRLDDPKEAVRYTAAAAIIHLNDVKNAKPVVKRGAKHSVSR
jgi:HEAT repeat protein